MRVVSKTVLGTGASLKVGQSTFRVERKADAFRAHGVWLLPGNLLGFTVNDPAEVLKLAARNDGRGLGGTGQPSGLTVDENSWTTVRSGDKTELPQLEVADGVGRESSHTGLPRVTLIGSRVVRTANTSVGSPTNEGEARPR